MEGAYSHLQTPQPWRSSPLPAEHRAQELPCLCLGLLLHAHKSLAIPFWSRNIRLCALLICKKSIFYFPKQVLFAFCSWLTYKIHLHLSFVLLCPLNVNCKERCLCGSCLLFCFSLKWLVKNCADGHCSGLTPTGSFWVAQGDQLGAEHWNALPQPADFYVLAIIFHRCATKWHLSGVGVGKSSHWTWVLFGLLSISKAGSLEEENDLMSSTLQKDAAWTVQKIMKICKAASTGCGLRL